MTYLIKNWHKFQHYKQRRPPWIKLYRDLLDDPEWFKLDGDASKVLAMCWLVASERNDGSLPPVDVLAFRFRMSEKQLLSILSRLSHWVLAERKHDASSVLAERYQDATSETEKNKKEEEEKEERKERAELEHDASKVLANGSGQEVVGELVSEPKRHQGHLCPEGFSPTAQHYKHAADLGMTRQIVDQICANMHNWSHANANRSIARKSDWGLTLHNFIRTHAEKHSYVKQPPRSTDGIT